MTSKKLREPQNWNYRTFNSKSGLPIRYGYADPEGPCRGTVVLTGGYGRHIEYYYEAINNWLDRGFKVYAMDWHGQGGSGRENPSDRRRPPTKDFDYHVEIFNDFIKDIVKPARDKPAFLCSHSKGGNIMLRYLHKYEKTADFPFSGAILGTPMIRINTYVMQRSVFRRVVNALDKAGLTHTPLPSLSQLFWDFREAAFGGQKNKADQERENVHEEYKDKTENYEIGFPTVGWLKQAMNSCDKVADEKFLGEIRTPVLILTSASDSLVSVSAQKKAADMLPNGLQKTFKDAVHGIWYDRDEVQEKLWQEIDGFTGRIEKRFHALKGLFLHIRRGFHNILKP